MGLRKAIRTLFKNTKSVYPTMNNITFIHHNPSRGNIGDYLCSPRHYFNFQDTTEKFSIIGGGVFPQFGLKKLEKEKLNPQKTILWGVGVSLRTDEPPAANSLPYLKWGIRDKDSLSDLNNFLPCVSCLHPMLDTKSKKTSGVMLFLNADTKVTSKAALLESQNYAQEQHWHFLLNNCSEPEFRTIFEKSETIITNSYHGAYWGLLAGKKVILFGYSSKFKSLLSNFDITSAQLKKIIRGDTDSFIEQLKKTNLSKEAIQLEKHKQILKDFRTINLSFADSLKEQGIISIAK